MKKITSFLILVVFAINCVIPPNGFAQSLTALWLMPEPGVQVGLTPMFTPSYLKGMKIDPNDPFKFDFIVNRGDEQLTAEQKQVEYPKLIKYFLAALAVPDTDQWVNLSPYEQDRVIPDNFGLTEMGRDLLAQDYLLKQISASLTNPDTDLGKKFWDGVYAAAYEKFGTTDIPTDTFNKVWIIPDKAVVCEKGNTVVVIEHHLKVMMEQDYLATSHATAIDSRPDNAPEDNDAVKISKQVMRDVIIPAIEKEANEGKNFAPLRQVYSGMLLATWYKRALKESILGKLYADQGKVKGIDQDPAGNQQIYEQYVKAFQKGVFNMIKEDVDQHTQELIPRKYFSGGLFNENGKVLSVDNSQVGADKAEAVVSNDNAEIVSAKMVNDLKGTVDASEFNLSKYVPQEEIDEIKKFAKDQGLIDDLVGFHDLFEHQEGNAFRTLYALYKMQSAGWISAKAFARVVRLGWITGLFHDAGYPLKHSDGETIKEGHERRSKEFVREHADALGLTSLEVGLVCLGISATQADVSPSLLNELERVILELMKSPGDQGVVSELNAMLDLLSGEQYAGQRLEIDVNQVQELEVFLGVVVGAKYLGAFDIWDARNDAIFRMRELWREFTFDMEILMPKLGIPVDVKQMAVLNEAKKDKTTWKAYIQALVENKITSDNMDNTPEVSAKLFSEFEKLANELSKLSVAATGAEQIAKTMGFYLFYADGRVQGKNIRKDLTDKFSERAGEIFEWLMQNGYFEETQGDIGRPKVLTREAKARLQASEYSENYDDILMLLRNGQGLLGKNGWQDWVSEEDQKNFRMTREVVRLAADFLEKNKYITDEVISEIEKDVEQAFSEKSLQGEIKKTSKDGSQDTKGGIDLNSASLDMQIRRDGAGVPLPVSQQNLENIRIDGLVPVILDIKPAVGAGFLS